jgi:hypothetical protein
MEWNVKLIMVYYFNYAHRQHLIANPTGSPANQGYTNVLLGNEREAVADLLQYLESGWRAG